MRNLLSTLGLIPRTIGLYVEAIFHTGHAVKSYAIAHRLKSDRQLYNLLKNQENLTQEQKAELTALVKDYKKTLKRMRHADIKQTD